MKKAVKIIVFMVLLTIISTVTMSVSTNVMQAKKATFDLKLNGVKINRDVSMVVIEGKAYMPVHTLCSLLDVKSWWNDKEKVVEIQMGEHSEHINLNITKETALKIGEALLNNGFSQESIEKTSGRNVRDRGDGTYAVCFYEESLEEGVEIFGGDITYIISKADGRVIDIEYGE